MFESFLNIFLIYLCKNSSNRSEKIPVHLLLSSFAANKTDSKLIEDWQCPTLDPLIPNKDKNSLRASQKKSAENGKSGDSNQLKPSSKNIHKKQGPPPANSNGAIPVHIILIIIGGLILMLIIVGFVSYYKAIRS